MTTGNGYAIVTLAEAARSGDDRVSLTDSLGCTDSAVDVYRPTSGALVDLPSGPESVCVPVDAPGTVVASDGTRPVPRRGIARVPAGIEAELSGEDGTVELPGDDGTTWIVVSAETDTASRASPVVLDAGDVSFSLPETSDVPIARLTARLGCTGMKVNLRRLAPGGAVPYHTEGSQEELFVPLDGPGTVRIDGETHEVPAGGVVRVAPETPRAAVNDDAVDRLWFMVGAPPTGAPDEWDPGAEILE